MSPNQPFGIVDLAREFLLVSEPIFLAIGIRAFTAAVILLIAWHGLSWMYRKRQA